MIFDTKPAVIGHRGLGKGVVDGHAENTLASFQAAVKAGLSWVEVDVRRTRDGTLVAMHYPTCDSGEFVTDLAADEAAARGLLSLDEVFDVIPPEIGIDVDVKTSLEDATRPRDQTTAAWLAPLLDKEAARRPLLVTSFDAAGLVILRERVPDLALGLLTWMGFPFRKAVPMAAHLGFDAVFAHWQSYGPNDADPAPVVRETSYSVRVAQRAGLEVGAWCPRPRDAVRLVQAGVDAIVVNEVQETLAALSRMDAGAG
ncbi:MAG: glycerophosphodiester phosphodiesterase [Carbonactinosporaceae bacterium]